MSPADNHTLTRADALAVLRQITPNDFQRACGPAATLTARQAIHQAFQRHWQNTLQRTDDDSTVNLLELWDTFTPPGRQPIRNLGTERCTNCNGHRIALRGPRPGTPCSTCRGTGRTTIEIQLAPHTNPYRTLNYRTP